jgi:hypothetical protein
MCRAFLAADARKRRAPLVGIELLVVLVAFPLLLLLLLSMLLVVVVVVVSTPRSQTHLSPSHSHPSTSTSSPSSSFEPLVSATALFVVCVSFAQGGVKYLVLIR